jgi:GT2 family glycosyltransferase
MGGFAEGYRQPAIEDIELGYRLKKAGYRIRLLKELQVKHLKRWNIRSLLKADFLYRALPWTDLILNEGCFFDDLNIKLSERISVTCTFILLLSLIGALFIPWFLVPALSCVMGLLLINWNLYRFFRKKRGLSFAVKSIPWHWVYFFYSGLAFTIGVVKHRMKKLRLLK